MSTRNRGNKQTDYKKLNDIGTTDPTDAEDTEQPTVSNVIDKLTDKDVVTGDHGDMLITLHEESDLESETEEELTAQRDDHLLAINKMEQRLRKARLRDEIHELSLRQGAIASQLESLSSASTTNGAIPKRKVVLTKTREKVPEKKVIADKSRTTALRDPFRKAGPKNLRKQVRHTNTSAAAGELEHSSDDDNSELNQNFLTEYNVNCHNTNDHSKVKRQNHEHLSKHENDIDLDLRLSQYLSSRHPRVPFDYVTSDSETDLMTLGKRDTNSKGKTKSRGPEFSSKGPVVSGFHMRATDRVVNPQRWAHSAIEGDFDNEAGTKFADLDYKMLVSGELEILMDRTTRKSEKEGRLRLLKLLSNLLNYHSWSLVQKVYAAVLRKIELGRYSWGGDFEKTAQYILLTNGGQKASAIKKYSDNKPGQASYNNSKQQDGSSRKNASSGSFRTKTWFCQDYQTNDCTQTDPHPGMKYGNAVTFSHICAKCWMKDAKEMKHPSSNTVCPHHS